jgi:hypothetical protein
LLYKKQILSTFADDTAIFTTHSDPTTASLSLQDHLNNIEKWFRKSKLKINENKSTHITFSLRQGQCPQFYINQTIVPHEETVKYLGLYFDRRLTWKIHIVTKRKQLLHKTRELKWLIRKTSPLSLENKLLLYKTVLKPIWTYGIELWGCTAKSNTKIIQRYQSKLLGTMTNTPWYVSNHTLHTDLRIPYVCTVFQEKIAKHRTVLTTHPIPN